MSPRSTSRRAVLALLGACAGAWAGRAGAKEPSLPAIPLRIRTALVAPGASASVVSDAFIANQIAESNRLFAPHGVSFTEVAGARGTVGGEHARLEDAQARDALAAFLERGAIDVFFVAFLRDVDDPALERMGVTWRKRSDLAKRYVIVSAAARETTLAHELGHFLGNGHTAVPNNLMSYVRDGGPVSLDAAQGAKSRRVARDLFARRVLEGPKSTR